MFEPFNSLASVFLGYIGSTIAAIIGVVARHIYHPDGFVWRRALLDIPFAVLCAIIAGGIGRYFDLPDEVIFGIAGSFGYLSPLFLSDFLQRIANKKTGSENGSGHEPK